VRSLGTSAMILVSVSFVNLRRRSPRVFGGTRAPHRRRIRAVMPSPPNRVLNRDQLIDLVKGREWTGYAGGVDPGDAVADQDGSRFRLWFAVPAMFSPRPPSASLRRQQSFDLRDRMMSEILGHLGDDLGFGFLLLRPLNSSLTAP
jgi:hypothetical protein